MQTTIYKRKVIDKLITLLNTDNILVLHGSRQVGKSSIMKYLQNYLESKNQKTVYIDLENSQKLEVLDQGVESFIQYLLGEGLDLEKYKQENSRLFVFIDEIQYLQNPSSFLKLVADHYKYLQLIVSGSSSFEIKSKFKDSLVGRTVNFEIFGLDFGEFLEFKKQTINPKQATLPIHIDKLKVLYLEFIKYGSYPKIVLENQILLKKTYLEQIIQTYIQKDIRDLAKIEDITKFNNLLKVLASQSGNLVNLTQLATICNLSRQTVDKYIQILEQTYILKLVYPFSKSIKVEVVKTPKVFFYDTGILQLLWLKNFSETLLGNIFETSIFSQLTKHFGSSNIKFWRNKNQNEIDFILELQNEITPIEVKTNFDQFRLHPIQGFLDKYEPKNYLVVGLDGKKTQNGIYPWEL